LKGEGVDFDTFKSAIGDAVAAIEEAERKSLAEYVVRRRVILDFMEILLRKIKFEKDDSGYQREDILHPFICPMRINSVGGDARIDATSHDLWIIDERLTFAKYFSSDVSFREMIATSKSEDRPDILIFDRAHGLRQSDDPSKVLIVEFKRPGRRRYDDEENPHRQVERYVRQLQTGQEIDLAGRPVRLSENTVFYCFIIADFSGRFDGASGRARAAYRTFCTSSSDACRGRANAVGAR
jgi:hypothetical protein